MVQINLFGKLAILENGEPSPLMQSEKGCGLVSYLIVTGQTQSREQVADLLFTSSSTSQSLKNLRTLLSRLRPYIPFVHITRKTLTFVPSDDVQVDLHALQRGLVEEDLGAQAVGVQLYGGELLESFYITNNPQFNEWLTIARERLRQRVMAAYRDLCRVLGEKGAWATGIAVAQHWVTVDDLDEVAYRWLMQLLAGARQYDAALQAYERCRQRLHEALAVMPDETTTALADEIQQQATRQRTSIWSIPTALEHSVPLPQGLPEPGPLPPLSYFPFHRNAAFVGREANLMRLAEVLLPQANGSHGLTRAVAVTGMGGLGKTQLAVEYAYRYGRYYLGGVYWLRFAVADDVPEEVAKIGGERGMQLYQSHEVLFVSDRIARVQNAWQEAVPRLLIFDNCEDINLAIKWLPVSGGCSVLVTSQHSHWPPEMPIREHPLGVLPRDESVALLQRLASHLTVSEASEVAEGVGDLPLALQLSGHFLASQRDVPLDSYLQQLTDERLLQHPALRGHFSHYSPTGHELHVARTFMLSFNRLDVTQRVDAVARKLLAQAACFAPNEPIPAASLTESAASLTESADSAKGVVEAGLKRLLGLGFLERKGDERVAMHRLVIAFVREVTEVGEAKTAVFTTIIQLLDAYKKEDTTLLTLPFSPVHLRHLTEMAVQQNDDWQAARLAMLWGTHLYTHCNYEGAKYYFQNALFIRQRHGVGDDLALADTLNHLGRAHYRLGAYDEAIELYKQALAIRNVLPQQARADLALNLRDLGDLYWQLDQHEQSRRYHEQVLAIRRQQFGDTHILIAQSLSTLGAVYGLMGLYQESRVYQEEALQIFERAKGESKATTARLLHNLGTSCFLQGDYRLAQECFERALHIRKEIYAPNHVRIASSLSSVGLLLMTVGELDKARPYFEEAMAIRQKMLGAQHLQTVRSMSLWGEWLLRTGAIEAATRILTQAMVLQEKLNPTHRQMADLFTLLGQMAMQQGDMAQANVCLVRALALWDASQQRAAPPAVQTLILFGEWHQLSSQNEMAQSYYQEAWEILAARVLPQHRDYQRVQAKLMTV